jgi:hypothetical protein
MLNSTTSTQNLLTLIAVERERRRRARAKAGGVAALPARPLLHEAQARIKSEARRYNVLACGRRFGKTTLCDDLAIDIAVDAAQPVGWFAPSYKLLTEAWRDMLIVLAPVVKTRNATDRRIELTTGGVIEFWTLEDDNAGRSRKYRRVIIDEAGLVPYLGHIWQTAIRPTLADLEGDAFFAGTPKGMNFFWECYLRGQDQLQPEWTSWRAPTWANPLIASPEIDALRLELSERQFAQEIEAAFLEDAGGIFRGVEAAATAPPQAEPEEGHQYVIGVDWAKTVDFTVFVVLDVTARRMVALDRSNQVDYTVQRARLMALAETWKPVAIIAEANAMGTPIIEQLQRDDLPVRAFTTTNATKAVIIEGLALAFERHSIVILSDPTLIAELQAYESERLPSGLTRYNAPEGMHDDCVMALALAYYGCGRPSGADLVGF